MDTLQDAKRELKKVWEDCRPSCDSAEQLFHYTSAEALHGILKDKKTLWLSSVSTLNDASEMLYGARVINKLISGVLRSPPAGRHWTLNLASVTRKRYIGDLAHHSYVACFCSEDDLVSQWSRYGAQGVGFAIGFDRKQLENFFRNQSLPVSYPMPMVYERDRWERSVSCFVLKADDIAKEHDLKGSNYEAFEKEFMLRLFWFALGMKNPSFSEEKEWRIVQVSPRQNGVKFRPARGIIIPYLELSDVPPNVFASVTLGPRVDPKFGVEPMKLFLSRNQLEHVKVRPSKLPIRALP